MKSRSISDRFVLAQKILSVKESVAQAVTAGFFLEHPEWDAPYGEHGRKRCTEDVCFHLESLAGAVEAGSPVAFADYARWSARVLFARGIEAHTLESNLAQLQAHLCPVLGPEEQAAISPFLTAARGACLEPEVAASPPPDGDRLRLPREVFIAAILNGHRTAALNIVAEALRDGNSYVDIYVDLIAESLHRVGKLWEMNKIGVAQEHTATAIAQYAVAAIYPRLPPAAVHRGNMVVTGVAGELHQIGANLLADSMEANGWTVRYLGTNLPHSSVLDAVEELPANVLCISTTILAHLPVAADLVRVVRDKLRERAPRIVLGGAAHRLAPRFALEIGATDSISDLRQALAILCP
jgi:methanogenic corrinoid protein MtbC1